MDYSTGKIYVIRSHHTNRYYIGSTRHEIIKRLRTHKRQYQEQKQYLSSYEILKYEDAYIELLEEFPCTSKAELEKREGELIKLHRPNCVNLNIAGRTKAQYYQDNRARILALIGTRKEKKAAYDKARRATFCLVLLPPSFGLVDLTT